MIRRLLNFWDVLIAAGLAVMAGRYLPVEVIKDLTTELIAFFAIQSAVILPAMIFTASILRAEGLSLSEADRHHKALRLQMHFWIVLLALDFLSVIALIAGKAFSWEFTIAITEIEWGNDVSWIFSGGFVFLASLALLRTIPFVRGVLSLLDLNSELTKKAIAKQNRQGLREAEKSASAKPFKKPEAFGKITTRPDA